MGVALLLIVFLGIFGAYRLGLKVINLSKNKITATAVANSRIEAIRNLTYDLVGIIGGELPNASGTLDHMTTRTVNGIDYTIKTEVRYWEDDADNATGDNCYLDYKKVNVEVSWGGVSSGSIVVSTDISPKNLVQEIQSCMVQPGGILEVTVFDSSGIFHRAEARC